MRPRELLLAGAHLAVLTSFALAQPLFDLLGDNAEFFAVRGSTPAEIVGFALAVTFAVPLAVLLLEVGTGLLHPALRTAVHLTAVALLASVAILHAASNVSGAGAAVLVPLALAAGVLVALAYRFAAPVRTFLTVLSPAPLVFLGLFLLDEQMSRLVFPDASAEIAAVDARTPVVLVVFDEFPVSSLLDEREEIDAVRYPGFAALAADSLWFRNATTVSDWTVFAAPAILSGKYPEPGELPISSDHPETLFTLLGGGYDVHAFMPFPGLCPSELCDEADGVERAGSLLSDLTVVYGHLVLPEDLRERLPSVAGRWQDFRGSEEEPPEPAPEPEPVAQEEDGAELPPGEPTENVRGWLSASLDEREAQVERFLDSLQPGGGPTLHVLHVMYPHHPWNRLPSGRSYGSGLPGLGGYLAWGADENLVQQAWGRHLLQAQFADTIVAETVRRLQEVGLYDRALVVFTADHGVSFRPGHSLRYVDEEILPDILYVPLLVKLPGQERGGTIVDGHVQTIDILPTVVDVLDVDPGWRFDGRSLLDGGTPAVSVLSRYETEWSLSADDLRDARGEVVRLQARLFGTGDDEPGLFRLGPYGELVGRLAADLPQASADGVQGSFAAPEELAQVDLASPYLPAHVRGTIAGVPAGEQLDLAVAQNGRITAVTRSFRSGDETAFSVVLPESAFRSGANDVRLYWIRDDGAGPALALIESTSAR